jgi:hypothetical protein
MSDISLRGLHVGSTIASHLEAEVPLEPPAFWMKWKKSGGASGPSRERMVRLRSNGLSEKCALSTPAALGRQSRPRGGPVTAIPAATDFSDFRHGLNLGTPRNAAPPEPPEANQNSKLSPAHSSFAHPGDHFPYEMEPAFIEMKTVQQRPERRRIAANSETARP